MGLAILFQRSADTNLIAEEIERRIEGGKRERLPQSWRPKI
jgi:hypothetical protein